MGISGVYKVAVVIFHNSIDMELHIKENKFDVIASLKDNILTRSFYNGRTFLSPEETESCNFIFSNAQVDDYTNITPPGKAGSPINLTPPGGYHVSGVELAGTVLNDVLTGTIKFKNGFTCSVYGKRIKGEPVVNTEFRTDGLVGVNRYCTCMTGSCTHHGFCDSCQIFNSLQATEIAPMLTGKQLLPFPIEHCMMKKYEKLFGPFVEPALPPRADGKPRVEHGPHHLVE